MKKYTVCFAIYGSVEVEAEDEDEAVECLEEYSVEGLVANNYGDMAVTMVRDEETGKEIIY